MMSADVNEKIAAAKERLAAAAARRAAREASEAAAVELAKLEREADETEQLEELEAKHGKLDEKIAKVDTNSGMIVVKRPAKLVFDKWQRKGEDRSKKDDDDLFTHCLLHPSRAEAERYFEAEPFAFTRCLNRVAVLAGVRMAELSGKAQS